MLYFAYGSNLNVKHMKTRCPRAVPLGNFYLRDNRLVFRGVADCMYVPGAVCPGGLWSITEECEEALDRYEGYKPDGKGLYYKEYIDIQNDDGFLDAIIMIYRMNSTGIYPPSQAYYDTIAQGYRDFRLPIKRLKRSVARAYEQKAPSETEVRRHRQKGFPKLVKLAVA